MELTSNPLKNNPSGVTVTSAHSISTEHPTPFLPLSSQPQPHSFFLYAAKLGYPENLIKRVLADLGPSADTEDLLSHLIALQDILPKDTTYRRDATHLPSYMIVQDSLYRGKEKMPFWVWVKRETISPDVSSNPPHKRQSTRSRSSSNQGSRS